MRRELSRFGGQADLAEIVARWPEAVGESIARNAWPSRIGRDGTIHVNTSDSVWAFELVQQAAEIAARLEVETVRFTPGPLAASEPEQSVRKGPEPSEEHRLAAAGIAAPIEDENLRKSVEKAVSLSLAADGSDRSV